MQKKEIKEFEITIHSSKPKFYTENTSQNISDGVIVTKAAMGNTRDKLYE